MADFEELDSFTKNIVERTRERQRALNNANDGIDSFDITSNVSKTYDLKSEKISNFQNQNNIMSEIESTSKVSDSSKLLIDNLSNISPDKKRIPLSQRLSSIARSYDFEDSENIDYIDSENNDLTNRKTFINKERIKSLNTLSIISESSHSLTDSPTKKSLNERLGQIARSYYPSNDFDIYDNNKVEKSIESLTDVKSDLNDNKSSSESPLKKRILLSDEKLDSKLTQVKIDLNERKSPLNDSPVKKRILLSEKTTDFGNEKNDNQKIDFKRAESLSSINSNKISLNSLPVKKQLEPLNENAPKNESKESFTANKSNKMIFNSNAREREVINTSTNVSAVRKQFESKEKAPKPETLSLRAKTDLFEKAILAENEAKSKQYVRKRMAPQFKANETQNINILPTNKTIQSKSLSVDESLIKRQKNSENLSPSKVNVSNNILMKRQLLEQRLFGSETTTATSVMKDVENRKKELEILKLPFKQRETLGEDSTKSEEFVNIIEEKEENYESDDSINDSKDVKIDNETAHQTVCEAFEEIENYYSQSEQSSVENINEEIQPQKSYTSLETDWNLNQRLSESPTKKNRLYPELFTLEESDEMHSKGLLTRTPPPEKPPRVYEQSACPTTPLRTISFYRREQSKNTTPSIQTIVYKDKDLEIKDEIQTENRNRQIQDRIDQLREEIEQHNRIAGQASQALNLCLEVNEFKGSTEQVEAERLLLVSGQKRMAALNEIQKLKISLSEKPTEGNTSKGNLTLFNIQLPVKGEFLVSRAKGIVPEKHHFICLIYNGANVIVTDLLNSEKDITNGKLDFSCGVYLKELSSDFKVVVHVYDLITSKHQLPHDIKYHIKKASKKSKTGTMKSPTVRSPGGPNAVLSTSFTLIGVVNLNLTNYMKKSHKMENFCYNCPLEGVLMAQTELKVSHEYSAKGFLDICDVNSFWTLCWFVLNGQRLTFWRFKEDAERDDKISPLGVIDLKECINPKVSIFPPNLRHVCMRPNTFALITISNKHKNNFNKGGTIPKSKPFKYLISAVEKGECIKWCELLSTVLHNIRLWESDSAKPFSQEEFDRFLIAMN